MEAFWAVRSFQGVLNSLNRRSGQKNGPNCLGILMLHWVCRMTHKNFSLPPNLPLCVLCLVAPYCAIPRDYLSDTPLLRAMGFLVSQHGQLGAIPPPPFLSVSTLESMRSGGAIPPPSNGYLCDTCAIPCENKANGCDTPSAILSRKGIARYGGGYLALGR